MAAGDVYEVVLRGHQGNGNAAYNVFHFEDQAGGGDPADLPQAILDLFPANMKALFSNTQTWPEASFAKIYPLPVGAQVITSTVLAGSSGASYVPQCAAVLKWSSALGGRSGRGRSYFGPVCEDVMAEGVLDATRVAALQAFGNAMIAKWGTGGTSAGEFLFGVWSRVAGAFHVIEFAVARTTIYTQRRRVPGVGI
jgi:hypothetical protein